MSFTIPSVEISSDELLKEHPAPIITVTPSVSEL